MKKIVLDIDIELDFYMCAISCHQMDYRLCWNLNKFLGLTMKKQTDYELLLQQKKKDYYSMYTYCDAIKKIDFTLVSNKGVQSYLIKEHPYFDYFLIVEGYTSKEKQEQILTQLQNIPDVLMSANINPNHLPSKVNLVFD